MAHAVLRELRLTAFKSFAGATLPLAPLTVLTGRNSSGKSNALDGIEVLARLAGGEDLADALDGRRREG
ncbi:MULTISPECIES: AAA family ATPase, partial [unclassified Frankia]|uniref:AAA family ATPase n=1 Tax=unclassified Frankia TaxID=2632575 RepID=UPI002AD30DD9